MPHLIVPLLVASLLAAPAGAGSLDGVWRLVEQRYGDGSANLVAPDKTMLIEFTRAGGLVEGTVRAGPGASGRFPWPSFVTDEGPIPVRVADLTVDPSGSSVTARYFVQPSAEDDLILEIVERYEAGGDGRTLTGTMTVRFTGGETNRGGYVLHRRFEREP